MKAGAQKDMSNYYFINFLEAEYRPDDSGYYVYMGGLGYLYVDKAPLPVRQSKDFEVNFFESEDEAVEALKLIEATLRRLKR